MNSECWLWHTEKLCYEERAGRPSTSTTDEKIYEVNKMRVIIDDESWVYGYDVETKAQSSQWKLPHEPRPKKARQILCAGVFAISLWIITSPRSISKIIQTVGSPVVKVLLPPEFLDVQLGVALAVLAIFVFFIAFMGFYGAITRSQFLLFMYAILVILLMLLEGSLFFYYTSDIAEKGVRDDGQLTHALRVSFQCCEFNYSLNAVEKHFPWSCCGVKGYPNNCTFDSVFIQPLRHHLDEQQKSPLLRNQPKTTW
ncbi:uncharacterized protein [Battus philenor]|uniref:uncharacterized protein n=1 Tax=Battus philenor TaxID=42288 RepID=UPI0035CFFDD1